MASEPTDEDFDTLVEALTGYPGTESESITEQIEALALHLFGPNYHNYKTPREASLCHQFPRDTQIEPTCDWHPDLLESFSEKPSMYAVKPDRVHSVAKPFIVKEERHGRHTGLDLHAERFGKAKAVEKLQAFGERNGLVLYKVFQTGERWVGYYLNKAVPTGKR